MLLDDPRSDFGGDECHGRPGGPRIPWPRIRIWGSLTAVLVLLIGLQLLASHNGFEGPLHSLWQDYVGTPKSMTMPWAGLALALVGLSWRRRLITLGFALVIDAIWAVLRVVAGGSPAIGNGAMITLTGLALVAWLCWEGVEQRNALRAWALGVLLILATKIGDVWLHITIMAGPAVRDRYVVLADHAFGEPSWVMGRVLDALSPVLPAVLHWVYIELPVAAMVVAAWQLRRVVSDNLWPGHYLVRTFLVLGVVGPVVYLAFPVVGPMFAFAADGHGLQVGNYWPHTVPPIDYRPSPMGFDRFTPRNCMPSMHTAWATAVFLHSRRDTDGNPAPRWLRWGGAFWLVCTLAATLGFGFHYGADLLAGAVLSLTVESVLREPGRGWDTRRTVLVGSGVLLLTALLLSYRYMAVWMAEYPFEAGVSVLGAVAGFAWAFARTWFAR
ncbi:MAG: inositol phosphorylceramide synthase, partial [Nocardia sp.]|nr:inositol phosphorylceramide synthase [Nocardia sp.]